MQEKEMKKSRFTEQQIHDILKESEAGANSLELCREYGISKNTFYNWRAKYGGLEVSDLQKMRELEQENALLKKLVAEQALDMQALKAMLAKKY
jgi:putative transposase